MTQTAGLSTPVQYLRGVGPKRAEKFRQLGIDSVHDLLDFLPRRYQFFETVESLAQLQPDQQASVIGTIVSVNYRPFPAPPRIYVRIADKTGECAICWFNCAYLRDRFRVGYWLKIHGKFTQGRSKLQFINPKFEIFETDPGISGKDLSLPIYPTQDHFGGKFLTDLIRRALADCGRQIDDWCQPDTLRERDLIDRPRAYSWIHAPENDQQWLAARNRLAYDELFFMQLGILINRQRREAAGAVSLQFSDRIDKRIRRRFPFQLTAAQNRTIAEIVADLTCPQPMSRLVQGDVGCGKTVVALYAALVAVANRRQVAIMAPTEILAQQHYRKITEYLVGSQVRTAILVGGTATAQRAEIIEQTTEGKIDILIGTHALIQSDVQFANLALVVIDEQHKFGVHQRAAVKSKGTCPHYLVMTATPIPRSLALTVFGDLDLSTIDQSPPGRLPVITKLYNYKKEATVWDFLARRVRAGDQAYVVYPLLEESEKLDLKSARNEAKRLAQGRLAEFNVELIHGRMKPAEKQQIMDRFRRREIDVLVATVVIEVGIDMPAANVLVVEHAERFGLAQLHQLRGRIGRAGGQGYCLFLAKNTSELARKRLAVLLKTTDGFKIAEEDLRIRGPGQFFGTAQHGLPELKIADLIEDFQMLLRARKDAERLLHNDPKLEAKDHRLIRKELIRRLGERLKLIEAA